MPTFEKLSVNVTVAQFPPGQSPPLLSPTSGVYFISAVPPDNAPKFCVPLTNVTPLLKPRTNAEFTRAVNEMFPSDATEKENLMTALNCPLVFGIVMSPTYEPVDETALFTNGFAWLPE